MKSISLERLRKRVLIGGTVFILTLAFASFAWASTITYNITGINNPGTISAKIIMDYDGTDTLSFTITNTSTYSEGSSLTAFAFNIPIPPASGVEIDSFTASASGWSGLENYNEIDGTAEGEVNTPGKLGYFDMAGITGSKFNGGNVGAGIFQTETFSFEFILTGSGLDLFTEDFNILSDPGTNGNNSPDLQFIVARFQGIGEDDLSDVGTGTVVPIPGAIVLLGSGLLGLAGIRRKFFS